MTLSTIIINDRCDVLSEGHLRESGNGNEEEKCCGDDVSHFEAYVLTKSMQSEKSRTQDFANYP